MRALPQMRRAETETRSARLGWYGLGLFLLGVFVPLALSAVASPPRSLTEIPRRTAVVDVAEQISPAVVAIEVIRREGRGRFRRELRGDGSGVFINHRGYLLTNYHVVREANSIRVHLVDGTQYPAERVAESPENDVAVLRVEARGVAFPFIQMGISSDLMAGEPVLALGNPYGLEHTVSTGVVSGVRRTVQLPNGEEYNDFIQTDAAINPGNSGGALVNMRGELIGINTAIYNQGWGIAFAIPVDRVRELLANYVDREHRLGVEVREVRGGLEVISVAAQSQADRQGLRRGDVLLSANGRALSRSFDLVTASLGVSSREPLNVRYRRDGRELVMKIAAGLTDAEIADLLWSRLGVRVAPATRRARGMGRVNGLRVAAVRDGSVAERVEIREGDLIVRVGSAEGRVRRQESVSRPRDLLRVMESNEDETLRVEIVRDGQVYEGSLRPEDPE